MNLAKTFLTILILLCFQQNSLGQNQGDNQPAENWLKEYNIYPEQLIYFRYDRYSKADIQKFREKLDLIKTQNSEDEWEGVYGWDLPDQVGVSELHLNFKFGFVDYYVYSCLPELRSLNYGKVLNTSSVVQLLPEFAENSPRKEDSASYVKVNWNDRRYLVLEDSLPAFAEKAVGIYVEPENDSVEDRQKWARYWVTGDLEKPLTGLPEFPAQYRNLRRSPIEAKITGVGKRTVAEKSSEHEYYAESAWYAVTIDAGKDKGIKKGMKFDIPEIEEEMIITEVKPKTSAGLIRRQINDKKLDQCFGDNSDEEVTCPAIKAPLKIKTQIGKFWAEFF